MKQRRCSNNDNTRSWLLLPSSSWIRYLAVLMLVWSGSLTAHTPHKPGHKGPYKEHEVKTAFLYNFIKFVDWSAEKMGSGNEPIVIGIVGQDDFAKAFEAVKNKKAKSRTIVVKQFTHLKELEKSKADSAVREREIKVLRECHLMFFSDSVKKEDLTLVLEAVRGSGVLTVSETAGFLENGGVINFVMIDNKVRFEINLTAARDNNLKIRSKLLKLAKRVVKEKPSENTKS